MAVQWPEDVNKKFYGLTTGADENYVEVQFESGRKRRFKKNSTVPCTHSFSFLLKNKAEEKAFWRWYKEDLQGGAVEFEIPSILDPSENQCYMLASPPSVDKSQYPKEATLEVYEA